MIIKTICKTCGKAFEPNSKRQKYCSLKCKEVGYKYDLGRYERARARKTHQARECAVCGKLYIPTTNAQKTCSVECAKVRNKQKRKELDEERTKDSKKKSKWIDHAICKRRDCLWHERDHEQWCSCLYCYFNGKPREPRGMTWRECVEYISIDEAAARGVHRNLLADMTTPLYVQADDNSVDTANEYAMKHSEHACKIDYFGDGEELER